MSTPISSYRNTITGGIPLLRQRNSYPPKSPARTHHLQCLLPSYIFLNFKKGIEGVEGMMISSVGRPMNYVEMNYQGSFKESF